MALSSASAFALPAATDDLFTALVTSGKLSEIVNSERGMERIEITRVSKSAAPSDLRFLCGGAYDSRSASIMKVEVIYAKNTDPDRFTAAVHSSSFYFVTAGNPAGLKLCDGR